MNEQILKDFIATAQKYNYDWNTVIPKFPELKNYDAQLLKDYVATAEKYNYDYSTVNSKFPEFGFAKPKKKEPTVLPSASAQEPSLSATQPKKKQQPSVSSAEKSKLAPQNVFEGYPGKEKNKYRVQDGVWQRQMPGQTSWQDIYNEGSINALNKQFNQSVKYSKARDLYGNVVTDKKEIAQKELDKKLSTINSGLIDKEEEQVVPQLRKQFPEFQFIETGTFTDEMQVVAPNGKSMYISLDNWTSEDDTNRAAELRGFIRANSNKELTEAEKQLKKAQEDKKYYELKPFQPTIRLGEGYGDENIVLDPKDAKTPEQPKTDIMTADANLKSARKEYAREVSETFTDLYDKHRAALKTGNELDERAVVAEYSQLANDWRASNAAKDYFNDISDKSKQVQKEYKDFTDWVDGINSKLTSGEISQLEYEEQYVPMIKETEQAILQRSNELKNEYGTANNVMSAIEQSTAANYIINESKGSVAGGIAYNFTKGLTDIARIATLGELPKEAQEDIVRAIVGYGTTEEYMTSGRRSDITQVLFSLSRSMGQLVSGGVLGAGVGAVGAGQKAITTVSSLPFFAGGYYEMRDQFDAPEFEGVSDEQKVLFSSLYGVALAALEKFGLTKALAKSPLGKNLTNSILKTAFKDLPKNATSEMIEQAIESSIKKRLVEAGVNTIGAMAIEGSTEMAQSLTQVGLKETFDAVNDKDYFDTGTGWEIFKNSLYEGYLGALGGGIMNVASSAGRVIGGGVSKELSAEQVEALDNVTKIEGMTDAFDSYLKGKVVTGEVTPQEAKEMSDSFRQMKADFDKIPSDIPAEDKGRAFDLMVERSKIEKQIEGKEENLVAAQNDRIKEINTELQTISQNAVQKQTAGEVPVQPEARVGEEVEEGKPQAEPQVVTEEGQAVEQEVAKGVTARQSINRPATLTEFGGNKFDSPIEGDVYVDGQQVVFEDRDTGRIYELGNVDEVMDSEIPGLNQKEERVSITSDGKVSIDGNNWNIQTELPTQGVEYNPAGEVTRVSLKDDTGKTRMFEGQDAIDIAYQIELQKYQTPEQQEYINQLLEQDEEFKAATEGIKPSEVTAVVQEEAITDTIQAEPTAVEVEQEAKTGIEEEIEKLGEVIDSTNLNEQTEKISEPAIRKSVSNAVKALTKIAPNVKFIVHKDDKSYRKATGELGRSQSSSGTYNHKTKEIHINLSKANARTVAHETFHAILLSRVSSDTQAAAITKRMINAISAKLESDSALKAKLDEFASNYEENIQNEEKLAELIGYIAENYESQPETIKDIIKRWLNKIAEMVGYKKVTEEQEVLDLLDTIGRKVATGKKIKERDVSKLIPKSKQISNANKRFQANFSDAISKLTFVYDKNTNKFKKLEEDGYITKDQSLSDFNGKIIFLHQPDGAFSGSIYKNEELLVEGKGGVFYPIKFHEDGYFWASTDATAQKMADDLNKIMEQNGGSIYMALTSAPSDKLLSSTTAANAVMDLISSKAFDSNFSISKSQLKTILNNAASISVEKKTLITDVDGNPILDKKGNRQYKTKLVGLGTKYKSKKSDSLDEISSNIKQLLNPDVTSFADRKTFVEELIKEAANIIKSNPDAVQQFGSLFSSGIQNKYFKGVTKTGKLSISAANMKQAISEMLTEPILKEGVDRSKGGQVYAILELNGQVKPVKSDKHESYPMAIQSADPNNKVKLHLLTDRQNWFDVFEDFETNDIVAEDRRKKVFPTSGVSVRGLRLNTSKVSDRKQLVAPNGKPSNLNEKQWNQVRTPDFKAWFGDWENDPENASKVVDENGEPLVVYHGTSGGFDEFQEEYLGGVTDAEIAQMGFFFTNNRNVAKTFQFVHQNFNEDGLTEIINDLDFEQLKGLQRATMKTEFIRENEYEGDFTSEEILDIKEDIKNEISRIGDISNFLDSNGIAFKASDYLKSIGIDFDPYVGGELYNVFLNIKNPYIVDGNGDQLNNSEVISYDDTVYDGVIVRNTLDSIPMHDKDGGIESDVYITKNNKSIKSATENVGTFSPTEPSIRKQISDVVNRKQEKSASSIVSIARKNGFSEAAIAEYLRRKGFDQAQIDRAMAINDDIDVNKIFDRSKQALLDKNQRMNVSRASKFLWNKIFDRQSDIKKKIASTGESKRMFGIGRLIQKDSKTRRAHNLLINRAGAKGYSNFRYKEAEKIIYKGLSKKDNDALDKLIYARRIISINENRANLGMEAYRGIDGYSEAEARRDIEAIMNELGDKKFNDLSKRADAYFDVFAKSLENLYKSGRITEETYNNLKDVEYSPIATIKYIIGDNVSVDEIDRQAELYGITRKDIMTLTDSNENEIIMDSKWLLMMNLMSVEARAWENKMLTAFADAVRSTSQDTRDALSEYIILDDNGKGTAPAGFRSITYFVDGDSKRIFVRNDMAKQLLDVKNRNRFAETLGTITGTKILRFFATGGNPLFIIGNTAVDFTNVLFMSDIYSPIKVIGGAQLSFDFLSKFLGKIIKSGGYKKLYEEYMTYGGGMDFLSNDGLRELNRLRPGHAVTNAAQKVLMKYGQVMSYLGETSEQAMRLAVFGKVKGDLISKYKKENGGNDPKGQDLEDILLEAARESRETIDFSQGGDWAKSSDLVMPYLNASLQGFRKPLDYATKNPAGFASSLIQASAMAGGVAYLSISALANSFDDDDEEDKAEKIKKALASINDHEKAAYHIIFTGKRNKDGEYEYYRVKKLPFLSVFTTAAEQYAYKSMIESLGGKYDMTSITTAIDQSIPFSPTDIGNRNPVITGLLTYHFNRDMFTGEEVFRMPEDRKIKPEAEGMYDDKVQNIYKWLAPKLGLSPIRSQAFVEKIITSPSTNPSVSIFYGVTSGLPVKDLFSKTIDDFVSNLDKKTRRFTNKDILKYAEQDETEKMEMEIDTEKYLKEEKIKSYIKKKYEDGGEVSVGEIIKMVEKNFDPVDREKYVKKYYNYIQRMDIDGGMFDIIYETDPEVQAMKIFRKYGSTLENEELKDLMISMKTAGVNVQDKTMYFYRKNHQKIK